MNFVDKVGDIMDRKTRKTIIISSLACALIIGCIVIIYPNIEFKKDGKLYVCSLTEDFSEFEENPSYNELYFYNEQHNISLNNFRVNNFLCFYIFTFDYVEGDVRETQFVLEEEFIDYWLKNAEIKENESNIDIAQILENKTAVVSNKRYLGNEYDKSITYVLDGEWETLYVFESKGLTVIQVGSTDESPKYIAYR